MVENGFEDWEDKKLEFKFSLQGQRKDTVKQIAAGFWDSKDDKMIISNTTKGVYRLHRKGEYLWEHYCLSYFYQSPYLFGLY